MFFVHNIFYLLPCFHCRLTVGNLLPTIYVSVYLFSFTAGENFDNDNKDVSNEDEESGHSNIQPGDGGTNRNPEDVTNEDEESGQSNIQQGDETDRNLEDVSNEDGEQGQSNIQQGNGTNGKLEDFSNEDEESVHSNIQPGDGGTDRNPEDVTNEGEESGQSNIQQGDETDRNLEDVSNEDGEQGQSNIQQGNGTNGKLEDVSNEDSVHSNIQPGGGGTDRNSEDVTNEDEESGQSNIQQGDETDRNLEDVSNEDGEQGQSNIQQGNGTNGKLEDASNEEEGAQSNIQQGDVIDRNLKDVSNEKNKTITPTSRDMVSDKLTTSGEGTENEQDSSHNKLAKDHDEDHAMADGNRPAGDNFGDSLSEHSSVSHGDGSDCHLQAEDDSNKKSEPTTPTTYDDECKAKQTELMDVDNEQLSTSGIRKEDEEDSSSNNSVGQDSKNDDDNKGQVKTDNGTAFVGEGSLDGRSEQSNIPAADSADSSLQETSQNNSTVENFDKHDGDKDELQSDAALLGDVPRDEQPNVPQKDAASNRTGDSNENSKPATSTSQEDENEKQIQIMDVDNDQRSTSDTHEEHEQDPQKDAASNLTGDSNENSKPATSTLQDENEKQIHIMDVADNDQRPTSDTQEEHEQDPSQKKPAGEDVSDHDDEKEQIKADNGYHDSQRGQSDIPQKDAESDLKQSLDEDSPNNSLTNESIDRIKTTTGSEDFEGSTANDHMNDEDINSKDDAELDGAYKADEKMWSESEGGRNGTKSCNVTTENSRLERRNDKPNEKENQLALNGREIGGLEGCDEIMLSEGDAKERSNMTKDVRGQNANVVLHASKPADGSDETQVESMEVDNQNVSPGVATDVVKDLSIEEITENQNAKMTFKQEGEPDDVKVEKMVVDSEHLSSGNSETNVDAITLEEDSVDTKTEIPFKIRNTEEDGCMKKDEGATSKDKMGGSGAVEDFSEPLTKSEGDTVTSASVDHEDGCDPTHGKSLDKRNSKRSRSIFDRLPECEKQESTNNDEESEADKKVGTEAIDHAFTEKETKNEEKESQDNKQDLSEGESEKNEFDKTTAFKNIDLDHDKNSEIVNENPSDGPSASEIIVGKKEAADFQVEIERTESIPGEDVSPGESKENEFYKTTAFKSIDSDHGKNSEIVNENPNDDPSASEINVGKKEAADFQDEMDRIESDPGKEVTESSSKEVTDKKKKRKGFLRKIFKKKKRNGKLESSNDNGETVGKKKKSKRIRKAISRKVKFWKSKKQKKKESTEDEVGDEEKGKRKRENPDDLSNSKESKKSKKKSKGIKVSELEERDSDTEENKKMARKGKKKEKKSKSKGIKVSELEEKRDPDMDENKKMAKEGEKKEKKSKRQTKKGKKKGEEERKRKQEQTL